MVSRKEQKLKWFLATVPLLLFVSGASLFCLGIWISMGRGDSKPMRLMSNNWNNAEHFQPEQNMPEFRSKDTKEKLDMKSMAVRHIDHNQSINSYAGVKGDRKPQPNVSKDIKNVVSYSLYGSKKQYTEGAIENAKLYKKIYPGWKMRVYYDNTVPNNVIDQLKAANVELVDMTGSKMNKKAWRFQGAADAERSCSRNVDSRLSLREKAAVDDWIQSDRQLHVMRDHPNHSKFPMTGGLWCSKTIPSMMELLADVKSQMHLEYMNFLNKVIWPMKQKSLLQHDSFSCEQFGGGIPFPTARNGNEFVGGVYLNGEMIGVDEMKKAGVVQKCVKNSSSPSTDERKSGDSNADGCGVGSENRISGVSGRVFDGQKKKTFTMPLLEESHPKMLNTNALPQCKFWGVVTTINAPTKSIYKASKQPKTCLVIVADRKTPVEEYKAMKKDTVVFLSVEDQEKMQNLEIVADIPWNHFGRKNIGYLYAIMHGASVIFDFDDDNELISSVPWLPHKTWLQANNTVVFNPYPTFINLTDAAWPRGFPLTQIKNTSTCKVLTKKTAVSFEKIGVVQSLANHDPDMDAIWRLTRKLPMYFDDDIRVLLPRGTFSSYNAQATVHYALWGTFLPISVHGRVSDIWRSYIMQRLMHDVGMSVGFVSPFVQQIRNAHNYQEDYMSERPLYEKTEALVKVLSMWKSHSASFEKRFVELFVELFERDFIGVKDVHLAQKWIRVLKQVNYKFPEIVQHQTATSR